MMAPMTSRTVQGFLVATLNLIQLLPSLFPISVEANDHIWSGSGSATSASSSSSSLLPNSHLRLSPQIHAQRQQQQRRQASSTSSVRSNNDNNNSSNGINEDNIAAQARIVGGGAADDYRYPYYVALWDVHDQHVCGGTLIAPDIVLTAAHCFGGLRTAVVGMQGPSSVNDGLAERIEIEAQFRNPKYDVDLWSYDQMVVKLKASSSHDPVKVNLDPNVIPDYDDGHSGLRINNNSSSSAAAGGVTITVIGFGSTTFTSSDVSTTTARGATTTPVVLQETTADYVPNNVCRAAGTGTPYADFGNYITDDMICAIGTDAGPCQGDSGGPYLILGDNHKEDLQVGIVSWAIGCADDTFPAVGARTSASNWIQAVTCEHSSNPPDYFDCANAASHTFSPAPSPAPSTPTVSPAPTQYLVPVVLTIYFDLYGYEIGWSIWDDGEQILFRSEPALTYDNLDVVKEVIMLPPGRNFSFFITDKGSDGMVGVGTLYELNLNFDPETGEPVAATSPDSTATNSLLLLEGNGDFGTQRRHDFYLPGLDEIPTPAPVPPTVSPAPTVYAVPIYLTVHLDTWPEETGWSIVEWEENGYPDKVYAVAPPGTYRAGSNITETIMLPPGRDYGLIMTDTIGDGILETEGYILWMLVDADDTGMVNSEIGGMNQTASTAVVETNGSGAKERLVLARGGGNFGPTIVHNFTL